MKQLQDQNENCIAALSKKVDSLAQMNKTLKQKQRKEQDFISQLMQKDGYIEKNKILLQKQQQIDKLEQIIQKKEAENMDLYNFINARQSLIDELKDQAGTIPGLQQQNENLVKKIKDLHDEILSYESKLDSMAGKLEKSNKLYQLLLQKSQEEAQENSKPKFQAEISGFDSMCGGEKKRQLAHSQLNAIQFHIRYNLRHEKINFSDIEDYFFIKDQTKINLEEALHILSNPPFYLKRG